MSGVFYHVVAVLKRFDTVVITAILAGKSTHGYYNQLIHPSPGGGIGRRAGFRCQWP